MNSPPRPFVVIEPEERGQVLNAPSGPLTAGPPSPRVVVLDTIAGVDRALLREVLLHERELIDLDALRVDIDRRPPLRIDDERFLTPVLGGGNRKERRRRKAEARRARKR